jgi:hypothetical protein
VQPPLAIHLSEEFVAELAARVAELRPLAEPDQPYLYGYRAAAGYLGGMPVRRLHYLVDKGEIPCFRLPAIEEGQDPRSVIFLKSDLDAFVKGLRPAA